MKRILIALLLTASASFAQTGGFTLTADIKNPSSDSLVIRSRGFSQTIKAIKPGRFESTFAIPKADFYQLFDGNGITVMYLKNDFNLAVTANAQKLTETIKYTGKGAAENNIMAQKMLFNTQLGSVLEEAKTIEDANAKVAALLQKTEEALKDTSLDENFRHIMQQQLDQEKRQIPNVIEKSIAANKMKGKPSPAFNLENHKGGTTSLESLKGKYVYIDVWATWCGPCKKEIPFLKEAEEEYKDKNIAFVSISIDKPEDHEKWKKFVDNGKLGGIQLFAEDAWKSSFTQAYEINSIPRFILIGPDGNVVDADAYRPSDPALFEQLDKLLK
jgi:thiol-disulfide isomerase/thioredoxin